MVPQRLFKTRFVKTARYQIHSLYTRDLPGSGSAAALSISSGVREIARIRNGLELRNRTVECACGRCSSPCLSEKRVGFDLVHAVSDPVSVIDSALVVLFKR